jgi:virulence-associated protein VapD
MYAIAFDMNTACLKEKFGETDYRNRYKDIEKFLESEGFTWKQGSLWYGNEKTKMGTAFLVARKLSKQFSWFKECVADIRVLRVEDDDDLKPHLE